MKRGWALGATAGLFLAAATLAAQLSPAAQFGVAGNVFALVIAIPPFAFDAVRELSPAVGAGIFVAWWVAVGAIAGWGLGRGPASAAAVLVFLALVVAGNLWTRTTLEGGLLSRGAIMEGGAAMS